MRYEACARSLVVGCEIVILLDTIFISDSFDGDELVYSKEGSRCKFIISKKNSILHQERGYT